VRLGDRREAELSDGAWAEQEAEVTELLTLIDAITGLHVRGELAGRDLYHPYRHEGHQADDGVVSFDDEDRPRGDVRQVGLGIRGLDRCVSNLLTRLVACG
jgi:hypothetical protein